MRSDNGLFYLACLLICLLVPIAQADERVGDSRELATMGKTVFDQWCWQCHGKGNPHGSGTWALKKRPGETRSPYLEDRTDMPDALIQHVVRHGQLFMPRFRYTEISEKELAALSAYLSKTRPESN